MLADHHVQLLRTFADQAVIAIENTRLFNETQEALERQTATADILKVIASSPDDVQPVFEAIASSANRLIGGLSTAVYSLIDDMQHLSAFTPTNPAADAALQALFPRPLSMQPWPEQTRNGEIVHVPDIEADPAVPKKWLDVWRMRGFRGFVRVPLRRDGVTVGLISVSRAEPGPFAARHIQLLQTFADQAIIAIENAQLFNEVQTRTRDLTVSLQQQTATAEVLRVINSSPGNLAPVFEAILEKAHGLCHVTYGSLQLYDGKQFRAVAVHGLSETFAERLRQGYVPGPNHQSRRLMEGERFAHTPDMGEIDDPISRAAFEHSGIRTALFIPLRKEVRLIGQIVAARREVRPFNQKEIALLENFAAQAVIAIENARLFNETKEALERQTATADILKVIASSPSDVQPVFEAIASSANRLLGGFSSTVFLFSEGMAHLKAFTPTTREADEVLTSAFPRPIANVAPFQMTAAGEAVQIPDTEAPMYQLREVARARGYRSMLFTPLMNKGTSIGFIAVTRVQAGAFADHHVQLLKTFADQAVIAIENARLFNEVQAKTRDLSEALTYQTGSANILKVIASSPTDVGPVLKAIVESACELCEAYDAVMFLKDGDDLHPSAHHGPIPMAPEKLLIGRDWTAGRAFLDRKPVHVHDFLSAEGEDFPVGRERARREGFRSVLSVPLSREGESIGAIVLRRIEVHPFSDKQIALLQTFADQAVIAIGNVQMFEEVKAKTRDLAETLQQQTATSEVLQIISSSQGDLVPVFDKMLENATRICGAEFGSMVLVEGDMFRSAALYNAPPAFAEARTNRVMQFHPRSSIATAIRGRQVVQVDDVRNSPAYLERNPSSVQLVELAGARTTVVVPMLREDEVDCGRNYRLSPGGAPLQRQADRPVDQFCKAGRDRDRKRAVAARVAPAHR